MSRRQIAERRELPLSSLRRDSHQKHVIFDSDLHTRSGRLAPPFSIGTPEPSRSCAGKGVHKAAAKQGGQNTDTAGDEFLHASRLFASLVFQQIRPHHHSATDAGEQGCSSCEPQPDRLPVSALYVRSSRPRRSLRPVTDSQAIPNPLPLETLFTELALRRLRRLVAKERP